MVLALILAQSDGSVMQLRIDNTNKFESIGMLQGNVDVNDNLY